MNPASPVSDLPDEPVDIDANGVDRAQVRAMLALSPEERLRTVERFVASALEIRGMNDAAMVR